VYRDQQGNQLSFNRQPNGNVYVQFVSVQNYSLAGWGTCYENGGMGGQTQFSFTLQFNGGNHVNQGTMYIGRDGRAYLQGQQDGGGVYYYAR
jgi:hypothetical protein